MACTQIRLYVIILSALALIANTSGQTSLTIQLRLHDVSNCLQWRELGATSKLNTIRQSLAIEVNKLCSQCSLNENDYQDPFSSDVFLTGANFVCYPRSEHQVTYRAQVRGTGSAGAFEIVAALQQWMRSSSTLTLTVDTTRYTVNDCPLTITSFYAPECTDYQTEFSSSISGPDGSTGSTGISVGVVVGVVIGVVLIMAVTGIIVVVMLLVFLRKREPSYTTQSRQQDTNADVTTLLSAEEEAKTTA